MGALMVNGVAGAPNDAPLWVSGIEAFCVPCCEATGIGHGNHNTAAHGLPRPSEQAHG